jgi:tol-pal system protein YbgF
LGPRASKVYSYALQPGEGIMTFALKKNCLAKLLLLIFPLLFFASCVTTQQDLLYLNDQIVALNARVDGLQESVEKKLSGDLDSSLESIRYRQAEVGNEINKIREEIQALGGRLEESDHLVKRAVERDTTEQDVMKADLAELSQNITALEKRVRHLYEYTGLEPFEALSKRDRKEGPAGAEESPSQSPPIKEKPVPPEREFYDFALATYKEAKYKAAADGFKRFLKKYPKSDLADNAQFWIGECYMALKEYEQAILAYQEVIKKYPKGNKVPNAMLRQSLAFREIKDVISSKLLLKKIIKQYPDSSEAKIAKAKLESLE